MNVPMLHYTLNTGHTRNSPRREVCDEVIQCLQPVIEQGGPVPGTAGLQLTVTKYEGGALFTVWQRLPIVSCAVAWTKGAEQELWPGLELIYRDIYGGSSMVNAAKKPAALPWLSVILLPPINELDVESVSLLGDLERCIAWAMFEAKNIPRKRRHVAKLLKQTGAIVAIEPRNGRTFTLAELQAYVGGNIQIVQPPGATGPIMVLNEDGKSRADLVRNELASHAWQEFCEPGSPRSQDDIVGDVVLCHMSQVD